MTDNIEKILNQYPKNRVALSPRLEKIYKKIYIENRKGTGLANKISSYLESWMHKKIEKRIKNKKISKSLEIGAGTLNHLDYVNNFEHYDVIEPAKWLYTDTKSKKLIKNYYSDIFEISASEKYDRVLSIATLEHVLDLPKLIEQSKQLLNKGGIFQAAIPCEGEFAWYCGWKFGTGIAFWLKHGLNYEELMKFEHVNNLNEISKIIKFYFKNIKVLRSPLPFLIKKKHTSFYAYIEAVKN
tara:strand:+ start:1832 stop:2554 length:723 start_codon:yes stop_codon:yes gene_type:complete